MSSEKEILEKIALVAHFGGLISFDDQLKALIEIRKLTIKYLNLEKARRIAYER